MKKAILFAIWWWTGCSAFGALPTVTPSAEPSIYEAQSYRLVFDESFNEVPNFFQAGSVSIGQPGGAARWVNHMPNGRNFTTQTEWLNLYQFQTYTAQSQIIDPGIGILNAWYYTAKNVWETTLMATMGSNGQGFSVAAPFYVETCCQIPPLAANDTAGTSGLWPSIWLDGVNTIPGTSNYGANVPEIDIFEAYSNTYYRYQFTVHDWVNNSGTDAGPGPIQVDLRAAGVTNPDVSAGFHIYGVLVTATTITDYFDGVAVASVPTPASSLLPMYIIADLATGGGWPVNLNHANVGAGASGPALVVPDGPYTLKIKYIRVWQP
jgi:hypothetical protein